MNNGRDLQHRYSDKYIIRPALIKVLQEQLVQGDDPKIFANIISLAEDFLANREFYKLGDVSGLITFVQYKMEHIADSEADAEWDSLAFRFHDVCLRYFNHKGDTINAVPHRNNGEKLFRRLPLADEITQQRKYHEFINRYSVCDTNEFAFQRAVGTLMPIQEREEKLLGVFPHATNEILGKIYGSMAQNFAFMEDNVNASEYFDKAKHHLGVNNYVQASYRAHLAIETSNKTGYMSEISFLFGMNSLPDYGTLLEVCMSDMMKQSFNFHLLLKGLKIFRRTALK